MQPPSPPSSTLGIEAPLPYYSADVADQSAQNSSTEVNQFAQESAAASSNKMSEITLPPLSSAVPMRRGAVSGASSGPSLPFPPIRLPPTEDETPSRGPSPTLGKRPSFSLGHSNHVPPGPDAHLPMPALSNDRRPTGGTSSQAEDYSRTGAFRVSDDGLGYYYARHPQPSREIYYPTNGASNTYGNYTHMNSRGEEPYYSHHAAPPPHYPGQASMYNHQAPRQMGYGLSMGPDDHLMPLNGKRPRSAPRVLSSQPRIFACSQCPARFARNHDLKRHQRGHLSVRPYPCTWCGKSFSRKDALKRHVLVKGCGKDRKGDDNGDESKSNGNGNNRRKGGRGNEGVDDEDSQKDGSDYEPEDDLSGYDEDDQSRSRDDVNGMVAGGLYRWAAKSQTMPSLADAATSLVGFAAARRPSASIA